MAEAEDVPKGPKERLQATLSKVTAALSASRASPPVLRFGADGEAVLEYDPALVTDLAVYGVWLKMPVLKETGAGELSLWVECAAPHCGKATGFMIANEKKPNPNIGNWLQHAQNKHLSLLRDTDCTPAASAARKRRASGAPADAGENAQIALSEEEELDAQARFVLTGGFALTLVENIAWREYQRVRNGWTMSRRALGERIKVIEQKEVTEPRNAIISTWLRPRTFRLNGVTVVARAKVTAATDGWTDGRRRQLESLTLCSGCVVFPGGLPLDGIKPELRPRALDVSLTHFLLEPVETRDEDDPGKIIGLRFDSAAHAKHLEESLAEVEYEPQHVLSPKNLLVVRTDTTNSQPAMVEKLKRTGGIANLEADKKAGAPPVTGAFYGECPEHVADLTAEDLDKVQLFDKVNEAVNNLSVFVRGSDKVQQVVLKAQEPIPLGRHAMLPVSFSQTRFHLRILQDERMDILMLTMDKIYANGSLGNDAKADEFNALYKQVALYREENAAIIALFKPQLENAALLGSTRVYTTSLAQVYYVTLSDHADKFSKTVPGMKIKPVVDAYQCSLLQRHAAVSTINKAIAAEALPPGSKFLDEEYVRKWKLSKRFPRQIYRDDMGNAAAYLDPAVRNSNFALWGHSTHDAFTFIVRLIKGCIELEGDADAMAEEESDEDEDELDAGAAEPTRQQKAALTKEYKKATKAIEDSVKESYRIDDAEFAREKSAKLVALRDEYIKKGLVIKEAAGAGAGAGAGAAPTLEFLERAIQDAVSEEMTLYDQRRAGVNFGDPLEKKKENKLRYQFWPLHASEMPLLNFAAEMLLGGMLSAMENERFHSAAAYVMNKLRRSLTVVSLNRLTLCKRFLTKALDAANELRDTRNALDIIDVIDKAIGEAP